MCNPIYLGMALGGIGSAFGAIAQNKAADAHNRGLEVQMNQQRRAEADLNNQLRNKQVAINENGVAARFQRSRQNLLDLGQVTAQSAHAGVSGGSAGRQVAVTSVKNNLDLAITNANQESELAGAESQMRSNIINTDASVQSLASQQRYGIGSLEAGMQILSGAFGGAVQGGSF